MWSFVFSIGPITIGVSFYHGICFGLELQELMEIDGANEEEFDIKPKNAWVLSLPIIRLYFLIR
jgi:hypothetical protein